MSLTLIATPIGNPEDITLRAMNILKDAEVMIGEERRETETLLKRLGLQKEIVLLNEHSGPEDLKKLLELCRIQSVALVTDCGTPGFCDPGADLVGLCRAQGIEVTSAPGASSLMTLISLAGRRLDQFYFKGFLPADRDQREMELKNLGQIRSPIILMDTPYRLSRLMKELAERYSKWEVLLGLDLTSSKEEIVEGKCSHVLGKIQGQKREFMLILFPDLSEKPKMIQALSPLEKSKVTPTGPIKKRSSPKHKARRNPLLRK